MEIVIGVLLVGLIGIVFFFFKFSGDEVKQQKSIEDAKVKRIADLDAEMARKDLEMKKMMEERQRMEEEFFKTKDQADIYKKENAELVSRLKSLEKLKEESSHAKDDLRQKDVLLSQETVARQKLQGEISIKEQELDRLNKEILALKQESKTKQEMLDGLKGQYSELEAELQKIREEALNKPGSKTPESKPEQKAQAKVQAVAPEPKAEPQPQASQELKQGVKAEAKPEVPELPGFPKQEDIKFEIKQGVPRDTDFLNAQPPKIKEEVVPGEIPEGAFKFTNINRPVEPKTPTPPLSKKPVETPQKPSEKDKTLPLQGGGKSAPVDKTKAKREVLIDGFHPKPPIHPEEKTS